MAEGDDYPVMTDEQLVAALEEVVIEKYLDIHGAGDAAYLQVIRAEVLRRMATPHARTQDWEPQDAVDDLPGRVRCTD